MGEGGSGASVTIRKPTSGSHLAARAPSLSGRLPSVPVASPGLDRFPKFPRPAPRAARGGGCGARRARRRRGGGARGGGAAREGGEEETGAGLGLGFGASLWGSVFANNASERKKPPDLEPPDLKPPDRGRPTSSRPTSATKKGDPKATRRGDPKAKAGPKAAFR